MPTGWFAAAAFAGASGFYLVLAGNLTWTEALAAVPVGAATAGFGTVHRRRHGRHLAVPLPPARAVGRTLLGLATDTARVALALARALARGAGGTAAWQPFRPGGISPRDRGRRALATLLTSVAPNGFVLDVRPSALAEADRGLLLHRLAPAPPLSNPDWPA